MRNSESRFLDDFRNEGRHEFAISLGGKRCVGSVEFLRVRTDYALISLLYNPLKDTTGNRTGI